MESAMDLASSVESFDKTLSLFKLDNGDEIMLMTKILIKTTLLKDIIK
jgi:hypothetical protein